MQIKIYMYWNTQHIIIKVNITRITTSHITNEFDVPKNVNLFLSRINSNSNIILFKHLKTMLESSVLSTNLIYTCIIYNTYVRFTKHQDPYILLHTRNLTYIYT